MGAASSLQEQQQQQQQESHHHHHRRSGSRSTPGRNTAGGSLGGSGRGGDHAHRVHFGDVSPNNSSGNMSYNNNNSSSNNGDDEDNPGVFARFMGMWTGLIAGICCTGMLTLLSMLYLTVRPFSVSAYRRLSAQLGLACLLDALVLLLPTTRIYLTGDSDVPSPVGTSILVSNHLCDADWWIMFMLGRSVGLQGTMKAFLRNEFLQVAMENQQQHQRGQRYSPTSSPEAWPSSMVVSAPSPASTASRIVAPFHHSSAASTSTSTASPTTTKLAVSSSSSASLRARASPDISLAAKLLHLFLDFPLVNGEDYIADREHLFRLLRSFAAGQQRGTPVHFLSFPEAWCLHHQHNGSNKNDRRQAILAKSNEFAQKESRPQLKHLLLPRTRGFNASLECLRESNPVVYDVTMAHAGYDGSLPPSQPSLSLFTLWDVCLRRKLPRHVYVRVKRYSLEDVLQDSSSWLDKKWHEKDRLLGHFARHGSFPPVGGVAAGDSGTGGGGGSRRHHPRHASSQRRTGAGGGGAYNNFVCRHREFDTWSHSLESSLVALSRLLILPCTVPIFFLLSIPIVCIVVFIWCLSGMLQLLFPGYDVEQATLNGVGLFHGGGGGGGGKENHDDDDYDLDGTLQSQTPGSEGSGTANGTPFVPTTPFASPTANWFSKMD